MELSPDFISKLVLSSSETETMNRLQLTELFDVTEKTILNWTNDGMPVIAIGQRFSGNEYSVSQCVAWFLCREFARLQYETAADRNHRISADLKELDFAERLGMVAPIDELKTEWTTRIVALRQAMLSLGEKFSAKIKSEHKLDIPESFFVGDISQMLRKLSEELADESES